MGGADDEQNRNSPESNWQKKKREPNAHKTQLASRAKGPRVPQTMIQCSLLPMSPTVTDPTGHFTELGVHPPASSVRRLNSTLM